MGLDDMDIHDVGQRYALVDAEGYIVALLAEKAGPLVPHDAIPLTDAQALDWGSQPRKYRWNGTAIVLAPVVERPPAPIYTRKIDIWQRATDAQAEALHAVMLAAPVKQRQVFDAADYILHDTAEGSPRNPFWPVLVAAVTAAVGPQVAAVLLAPSPS